MVSRIEKFKKGVTTDLRGTLLKSIRLIWRDVIYGVEDGLYYIFKGVLLPLPNRTRIKLKGSMSPRIKLDYDRRSIDMYADSDLTMYRAQACGKEPETVRWIETHLRPGDVFYDIGANVGAYSLIAGKHFDGKVVVYAFEPSFSNFYQLCRNITLNDCQNCIIPLMVGLAESTSLVDFHYQSLEAGSARHLLGDDLTLADGPAKFVYAQRILGFSLDDLVSKFELPVPNHIKLDVDGTEFNVLRGAAKTLKKRAVKSILVELHDFASQAKLVTDLLAGYGFSVVSQVDRGDGHTWNYIFTHKA